MGGWRKGPKAMNKSPLSLFLTDQVPFLEILVNNKQMFYINKRVDLLFIAYGKREMWIVVHLPLTAIRTRGTSRGNR